MEKRLRWYARLGIVVAGALLSGLFATTGSASADATHCSWSHSAGKTCLQIWGDSLYVVRSHTTHNHWSSASSFCGYKAKNSGTLRNGSVWVKVSPKHSGCSVINAWVDMRVGKSFKNGTKFCGRFYHDGAWAPGIPCATIKV